MNHCIRVFLLLTPSLIALGLLATAFGTSWWLIPLEKNIPQESSLTDSDDFRGYRKLIAVPTANGLLSECVSYRNIKVYIPTTFDFREKISPEDRLKLQKENCTYHQWLCATKEAILRPLTRCIDLSQKCDGIVHCEDKSDELSCNRPSKRVNCSDGFEECRDGRACYRKKEQTCDGVANCFDDSDEQDCNENKCRLNNHVYCPREKKCARRANSYRCDGIADCADNSDEEDCEQCNRITGAFQCDSKCLLPVHRCDGIVDCSNLRDESNCGLYPSASVEERNKFNSERLCEEKRFNPFQMHPPKYDSSLESYPQPHLRREYLDLVFFLRLVVFYGIAGGLIFLFLSLVSLLFLFCCRKKCTRLPFLLYGFWTLLAWLFICVALLSFVNIWFRKSQISLDHDRNLPIEAAIYNNNLSLQYFEFFGLSFWLASGAALATLVALLLSCCVCCNIGSSRSENKEYEIMHMQNY